MSDFLSFIMRITIRNLKNVLTTWWNIWAKSSKRIFLWEHAEKDSIAERQNKEKRVAPMPHARKKNVHAKLLKPRSAPINTCVENDDWPRAKPGGRKRCFISHEKEQNAQKTTKKTPKKCFIST